MGPALNAITVCKIVCKRKPNLHRAPSTVERIARNAPRSRGRLSAAAPTGDREHARDERPGGERAKRHGFAHRAMAA